MLRKVTNVCIPVCVIVLFFGLSIIFTGQLYAEHDKPVETIKCWCCDGKGGITSSTGLIPCKQRGPQCFESEEAAEKFCKKIKRIEDQINELKDTARTVMEKVPNLPKKEFGWCCHDKMLVYLPKDKCKGTFYESLDDAVRGCIGVDIIEDPECYCCVGEEVKEMTVTECKKQKGGRPYLTKVMAKAMCDHTIIYEPNPEDTIVPGKGKKQTKK